MTVLLDEAGTPTVRDVLRCLIASAARADFAVSHVRLAAIDLAPAEAARVRACRFLLGRLDASSLWSAPQAVGEFAHLRGLRALVARGAIEVRSSPLPSWSPDFSVFRGLPENSRHRSVCIVGAHYFGTPPASTALTCLMTEPRAIAVAARRFELAWSRGHDVAGVVIDAIDRLVEPRS
jgi:hypothetical protein